MTNLIKHQNELEEDYRSKDLLNREDKIIDYSISKLDKIQRSGVVGLIGPFGCGKTTFINQIIDRENKIDGGSKRLNFDAWKYPDRKDLRENFILDMAQNLDKKGEGDVINQLKGQSTSIFEAILNDGGTYIDRFIPNIRKYLFNREKRELHLIESLLKEIFIALHIGEAGEPISTIYIVIEDIDRSGDAGVYFLQTLNYFLKKINLGEGLKIIAIATIGSIEFRGNLESYLKCLDYIHNFPVVSTDYKTMIKYFLDERCYNDSMIDFINYISKQFVGFTPRILKHILRDLLIAFNEFDIVNSLEPVLQKSLVLFGMITAKYVNVPNEKMTFIDLRKKDERINESIFESYFLSIITEKPFLNQVDRWKYELLNPSTYNEAILDYSFIDFGDDETLISIQRHSGASNITVCINKRVLLV